MRSHRPDDNYIGTFGYMKNSVVKDLGVDINHNYNMTGKSYVGGIAGRAENSSITNCYVTGRVIAIDSYAGMIAGQTDNTNVENCYNITGPASMKLYEGYAAVSSGMYTIAGTPAPVMTKFSGVDAATWNNNAKTLDIAAGLLPGMYHIVLSASNGLAPDAALTFTLSVNAAGTTAPGIKAPNSTSSMTLYAGYVATSTNPFTITGSPAPSVTITSGVDSISWNNSTKRLDISAGLPTGTYNIVLRASNGTVHEDLTFIISVLPENLGVDPPPGGGKNGGGGCNVFACGLIALFVPFVLRGKD
ncbi:MAG: hypothetical protein FWF87_05230 [Synergistaceae bacterium]|nr:hypothetical protein [Synergistaceae bacterium]